MAASKPDARQLQMDDRWTAILRGDGIVALGPRLGRRAFALFPGRPRCKFCNAPYGGPAALPFRMLGYRVSQKTPHVCARCLEWAPEGGAIVPISILLADVRGYTGLTRSMPAGEVPGLLNQFYDVASRVLLREEGVLGQIAGDQVMGLFVPGLSGRDFAGKAVAAAAGLLEAVGYGTSEGPWIEVGIGISTGEEFCGNVGGGGFKDFTAVGEVTNISARLTVRAGAGEALVDDATRSAAGGFNFVGAETVTVNSRSAQVPTFRLVLEGPAAADGIEPITVLLRSSLFAGLPPQLAAALRRRVHRRTFPAGAYIAREGEPADSLFVIEHGLVRVSRTSQRGHELVLGLLTVGETLGELGVLDASGTRTADAVAVEPTTCVTLSRHDLHTVIRSAPELGLRLMSRLVGYVRRKDEELAEIAFLDVPGRLANKLLQLAANHGETVDGGVRIRVKVPQSELAAMVGASREHVNRALARLIALHAVSVEKGTITILDADRLKSMC